MKQERLLDRREFTLAAALAVLSGVAITVSGCGSDSSSPTAPSTTPTASEKTGAISSNHGHSAAITSAQLSAGALTLNIQGTSAHPHTVTLAASDVSAIAGGQRVAKDSSTDSGHSHTVTFN